MPNAPERRHPSIEIRPGPEARLSVKLPYRPDLVRRIRGVAGRRWDPAGKRWTVPRSPAMLARLLELFEGEAVTLDAELGSKRPPEVGGGSGGAQSGRDLPRSSGSRRLAPPPGPAGELLGRMRQELGLRGYSPRTRKAYLGHARRFLEWLAAEGGEAGEPTGPDLRRHVAALLERRGVSHSYANQCVSALKFLYGPVLGRPVGELRLPRPRPARKLPVVLSRDEVRRLFAAVANRKHRALLMLVYSSGLRVGEVVRLRPEDLDAERGLLHVRQGKGRKDRYVMLSAVAVRTVGSYVRFYRPTKWLFPGARPGRHLTERSVQHVFARARHRAGIHKSATVHTLRHSFATHLLERGVSLRYIQELLGHTSPKTTQVYTRVARGDLARIESPLDELMREEGAD